MSSGSDQASVETQTLTARAEWAIPGDYFKLLTASLPVTVELYKNNRRVLYAASASKGFYQRVTFDRIVITPSGSTAISFLAAPDLGGNDTLSGSVDLASPAIGVPHSLSTQVAGAASAQILAANASRRYLAIQNQHATDDVYIHTAGGPAAVGGGSMRVRAGETWEPAVAPTGAIFAIRGANAITLTIIEA